MNSKKKWKYDRASKCHLVGTPENGCGIFLQNGVWKGNVCCNDYCEQIDHYATQDEAKAACLKLWKELKEQD